MSFFRAQGKFTGAGLLRVRRAEQSGMDQGAGQEDVTTPGTQRQPAVEAGCLACALVGLKQEDGMV